MMSPHLHPGNRQTKETAHTRIEMWLSDQLMLKSCNEGRHGHHLLCILLQVALDIGAFELFTLLKLCRTL